MRTSFIKSALLCFLVCFVGCAPVNSAYSGIKGFFFPKKIDVQKQADLSQEEKQLAQIFAGSEEMLHTLIRELKGFERDGASRSADYFHQQFEFVNGVVTSDLKGEISSVSSSDFEKQVDMDRILEGVRDNYPREVQLVLPDKKSNTDIFILKPLFKDYNLDGYIVVGINLEALLDYNNKPDTLVVLTQNRVLWSGKNGRIVPEMMNLDWDHKLTDKVKGKINIDNEEFFWFARYIGVDPIVYVLKRP